MAGIQDQGQGLAEPVIFLFDLSDFEWAKYTEKLSCESLAFFFSETWWEFWGVDPQPLNFDRCHADVKKRSLTGISLSCQHTTLELPMKQFGQIIALFCSH